MSDTTVTLLQQATATLQHVICNGLLIAISCSLAAVAAALFNVAANLYLSSWTDNPGKGGSASEQRSLLIYVSLGCASQLLSSLQTVLLTGILT